MWRSAIFLWLNLSLFRIHIHTYTPVSCSLCLFVGETSKIAFELHIKLAENLFLLIEKMFKLSRLLLNLREKECVCVCVYASAYLRVSPSKPLCDSS